SSGSTHHKKSEARAEPTCDHRSRVLSTVLAPYHLGHQKHGASLENMYEIDSLETCQEQIAVATPTRNVPNDSEPRSLRSPASCTTSTPRTSTSGTST